MKAAIKTWLDANVWDGEDRSGCKGDYANHSPDDLQELVEECMADIAPKWIAVGDVHPTDESLMYWVLFPDGKIEIMYFNQYSAQLTNYNKWQNLGNDDQSMRDTKYIKIEKPEPPIQPVIEMVNQSK